jgi:hypothetical protein
MIKFTRIIWDCALNGLEWMDLGAWQTFSSKGCFFNAPYNGEQPHYVFYSIALMCMKIFIEIKVSNFMDYIYIYIYGQLQ